jgi:hypothetical protein
MTIRLTITKDLTFSNVSLSLSRYRMDTLGALTIVVTLLILKLMTNSYATKSALVQKTPKTESLMTSGRNSNLSSTLLVNWVSTSHSSSRSCVILYTHVSTKTFSSLSSATELEHSLMKTARF